MFDLPPSLLQTGISLVISPHLAGGKQAILNKAAMRLYVSPAMYDLIKHADRGELQRILAAIEIKEINIPELNFFQSIPMTVSAPRWKDV